MTLYEIDDAIRELMENAVDPETGEISPEAFDELEALQMAREDKIEGAAILYKEAMAEADAIKSEKMALSKRQSAAEHKAESLKNYIAFATAGEKFKTPKVSVSFRKSETVNYTDIKIVPSEYLRYKDPEVDKVALKAALKTGADIPGCWIEEKQNVQVK